jgi:S1-C subfamily serine protease
MVGSRRPAEWKTIAIATGAVFSLSIATFAASISVSGASPGELAAIEALCGSDHSAQMRDMCVNNQVSAILRTGRKPDLSVASSSQREAIDRSCADLEFPADRFGCERARLAAYGLPVHDEPGAGPLHVAPAPESPPPVPPQLQRDNGDQVILPPQHEKYVPPPPERFAPPDPGLPSGLSSPRPAGLDRRSGLPFFSIELWRAERPPMPAAQSGSPPARPALYDQISPSVYIVRASDGPSEPDGRTDYTQGGAVAISTSVLVTNCHIIARHTIIRVSQLGKSSRATIAYADPAGDRCFLNVEDMKVNPVQGVRRFSDLRVGETVYSLGAPVGLELSFGEGMVSGLRAFEGVHIVQNSAPTWHGSSGGGLFDARGNLVGITTAVATNVANLSFSIAAEDFWF